VKYARGGPASGAPHPPVVNEPGVGGGAGRRTSNASGLALVSARDAPAPHAVPITREAVRDFAAAHGRELAGPCWEIYGHAGPDPREAETEVFWLLR